MTAPLQSERKAGGAIRDRESAATRWGPQSNTSQSRSCQAELFGLVDPTGGLVGVTILETALPRTLRVDVTSTIHQKKLRIPW